jgi:hypothetical protein
VAFVLKSGTAVRRDGALSVRCPRWSYVTPHERRVRELQATRRLIADLEALIHSSRGAIPKRAVVAAFEQHTSLLPPNSKLLGQLQGLARKLRDDSATHIAESRLRHVAAHLQQRADDFGVQVEARDARLKAKH